MISGHRPLIFLSPWRQDINVSDFSHRPRPLAVRPARSDVVGQDAHEYETANTAAVQRLGDKLVWWVFEKLKLFPAVFAHAAGVYRARMFFFPSLAFVVKRTTDIKGCAFSVSVCPKYPATFPFFFSSPSHDKSF